MKILNTQSSLLATAAIGTLLLTTAPASADYGDINLENSNNGRLTIYFTRHGEKQTVLKKLEDKSPVYTTGTNNEDLINLGGSNTNSKAFVLDSVCGVSKCAEELSDRGELYAELLADWFEKRGITDDIDAVYATHKTRTQQTVRPTAEAVSKLEGVVIQLPMYNDDGTMATELNPESTTPSECATLNAIGAAQADPSIDTIVIAGHSGTLYDIMGGGNDSCSGLGLDITSEARFPKDTGKNAGKVANFGDLWKVVVRPNGTAVFKWRKALKPAKLIVTETAR